MRLEKIGIVLSALAVSFALSADETPTERFVREARELYASPAGVNYTNTLVTAFLKEYAKPGEDIHALETGLGWRQIPYVRNVRDLGGWNGLATGQAFRGSQLYTNEIGGVSESTRAALAELGVKTDLDLRGWDECEPNKKETLNFDRVGLKRIHNQIQAYLKVWASTDARKGFGRALKVFARDENYPIYFHCKAGADRTGTLAWVLEGLCGASEVDMAIDYELTSFAMMGQRLRSWYILTNAKEGEVDNLRWMIGYVKSFPGETLADKFAAMVKRDFGLTDQEIAVIRRHLGRKDD